MINGYIKAAAAACEIRVADCEFNTNAIIDAVNAAAAAGVRVVVLPELCVTGYTCGDLFLQKTLLAAAEQSVLDIAAATKGIKTIAAVGAPLESAGKLYNCAVIIYNGDILGVVPKTNIPDYSEFYEGRYFNRPRKDGAITLGGREYPFSNRLLFKNSCMPDMTIGFEICEDLWVPESPSAALCRAGAVIIGNLSASDETVGKADYRRSLVKMQSAKLNCAYLYADAGAGESTTDLVFSGHNIIAENGTILSEAAPFSGEAAITEVDVELLTAERRRMTTFEPSVNEFETVYFEMPCEEIRLTREFSRTPFVPSDNKDRKKRCEEILAIQSAGLKKRILHTDSKKIVVGLSGGLDSTLALLVAVTAADALNRPRTDICAVTMPCFGTTRRTRSNAEILARSLGVDFKEIPISDAVNQHFYDIGQDSELHDVTFENSQARERTQVLMDYANKSGGLVIGTGDLSELALGWATYNGDHMSMYAVNSSIPKTLVRYLVKYYADSCGAPQTSNVLNDILDTPVSPELLPSENGETSQKTEDIVGPYELHDFFIYYTARYGFCPRKIYRIACFTFYNLYSEQTILKWLKVFYRRFFSQQFKRSCMPDGVKIGSVSFSPRGDFRMPSDASARLWLNEVNEIK